MAATKPPWLIYSVYLFEMSKGLVASALLGGATALYMNAFDKLAVYLFAIVFVFFFLWRLIGRALAILFRPLVRALYWGKEAQNILSRMVVIDAVFEAMKLLVFFLTILAFTRHFETIHQINYDVDDIPILRLFVSSLEAFESHVLNSKIFTGTVSEMVSSIFSTILSILVLSFFGFLWSRKKK